MEQQTRGMQEMHVGFREKMVEAGGLNSVVDVAVMVRKKFSNNLADLLSLVCFFGLLLFLHIKFPKQW